MKRYSNGELHLEKVRQENEKLLLEWRNEDATRHESFQTKIIEPLEHHIWFNSIINNPNITILVLYKKNVPIGMIRFECENKKAVISYTLDHNYRGCGYGYTLIEMAQIYAKEELGLMRLYAKVKSENYPSKVVLCKNGFVPIDDQVGEEDVITYELIMSSMRGGGVTSKLQLIIIHPCLLHNYVVDSSICGVCR